MLINMQYMSTSINLSYEDTQQPTLSDHRMSYYCTLKNCEYNHIRVSYIHLYGPLHTIYKHNRGDLCKVCVEGNLLPMSLNYLEFKQRL